MAQIAHSLNEILPTLKRIDFEGEELTYAHGKTYKENGLFLKHQITSLKIKSLVQTFARKLKRNLTASPPINFHLEKPNQEDTKRWVQWKGWDIQDHFQGFIIILDIIMIIATLVLSTFQAFLDDFKNGDEVSPLVIGLKIAALAICTSRVLMAMVTIDYVDDTLYLYVTDIIFKQLKRGTILIRVFSLSMIIASLILPSDSAVGIIFFFSAFLQLYVVQQNLKILELLFINSIKKFYIWNLLRIVIFDIIFAHIIATALLATAKINSDSNWVLVKLINNNLLDSSQTWYVLYTWSYYWACTIMMTVGFGDISPVDYRQSMVISFLEIFSSIVLAYNISEVGSIVSKMRNDSQKLERQLGVLRRALKKNPISDQLQCKIESYLSHEIEIRDRFQYQQHRAIIQHLPQQLKQQFFLEANQNIYGNIPVFCHFQSETLSKINRAIKGRVYYPREYIINHKVGFEKMIILCSGTFGLAFWKPNCDMNGTIIQSINIEQRKSKGMLITNNILSKNHTLNYDIIALSYSYGMQLSLQSFIKILKENSLDYYYYRSVLDKHEKEINNYSYISCEYCHNEYHTKFQCTKLHYIPIKSEKILRSRNYNSIPAQRKKEYFRMKHHKAKHAYIFRKRLFSVLQQALNISSEEQYGVNELDIDLPDNFYMYFKGSNPENLLATPICRFKSYHKSYLVRLKSQMSLTFSQFM